MRFTATWLFFVPPAVGQEVEIDDPCALEGPRRADVECAGDYVPDLPPEPVRVEAYGGLAALAKTPVALVGIELGWPRFQVGNHSPVASVRISYRFHNPTGARAERVGIRVAWFNTVSSLDEPAPIMAASLPPAVRIDGAPFDCTLEQPEWRPYGPGVDSAEGWCVGALPIPAGVSTHVVEYDSKAFGRGHYWYTLRHGFDAEATWAGPVETLEVNLPLGMLPGYPIVVSPPGHVEEGGVLRWHLKRPDLSVLPPVYVGMNTLTATPRRPRAANRGYTFAASSRLAPEKHHRYDADRALDGDGGTAWCEGVPGPGIGEWLEVRPRLAPELAARCWLIGFSVIPGVARNTALWLANNRVDRFRISSCAHPEEGVDFDLRNLSPIYGQPRRFPDAPHQLAKPGQFQQWAKFELEDQELYLPGTSTEAFLHERECFRFTILGVKPGKVDDSCVGEFLPLLSCAEGGFAYPIRPVK
jgi:hypothetical protein